MTWDPTLITALVAAAVPGVVAVVIAVFLHLRLRQLRAGQRLLLGEGNGADLVDGQAVLARDVVDLKNALDELRSRLEHEATYVRSELSTVIRYQGLVRYDAYRDMGGGQSWSMALLDEGGSGTVISCLHARDHARVYVKDVTDGVSTQRLSPEEKHAITMATEGERRRRSQPPVEQSVDDVSG